MLRPFGAVVVQPDPTRLEGPWPPHQGRAIARRRRVWIEANAGCRRIRSFVHPSDLRVNRIGLSKRREFTPALVLISLREPTTGARERLPTRKDRMGPFQPGRLGLFSDWNPDSGAKDR
jgi:hypothetical protein